jgi:hypothetical protein
LRGAIVFSFLAAAPRLLRCRPGALLGSSPSRKGQATSALRGFSPGADTPAALTSYGLALFPSGILYLFGGPRDGEAHTDIHQLDPLSGDLTVIPDVLPQALAGIRRTLLPDSRVLLFGRVTDAANPRSARARALNGAPTPTCCASEL